MSAVASGQTRARPGAPAQRQAISAAAADWATVRVLWKRDVVRFFRERSRVVGALVQPLIFWLVIGSGLAPTFRVEGAAGLGYLAYFFPGVVLMVALFTAIFATMSLIEDRHQGFLQAVLVAPGSRTAVVLGKSLGASTVAWIQCALFVALAPVAGFDVAAIDWALLAVTLVATCLALSALGFAVAWWLDSTQAYHVVMFLFFLPLWILSGAMFPAPRIAWLETVLRANPLAWAVGATRQALHGGHAPEAVIFTAGSGWIDALGVVGFAAVAVGLAVVVIHRKR